MAVDQIHHHDVPDSITPDQFDSRTVSLPQRIITRDRVTRSDRIVDSRTVLESLGIRVLANTNPTNNLEYTVKLGPAQRLKYYDVVEGDFDNPDFVLGVFRGLHVRINREEAHINEGNEVVPFVRLAGYE